MAVALVNLCVDVVIVVCVCIARVFAFVSVCMHAGVCRYAFVFAYVTDLFF